MLVITLKQKWDDGINQISSGWKQSGERAAKLSHRKMVLFSQTGHAGICFLSAFPCLGFTTLHHVHRSKVKEASRVPALVMWAQVATDTGLRHLTRGEVQESSCPSRWAQTGLSSAPASCMQFSLALP